MTIEDEIQALYDYWQPVFDHPTLPPGKWELVDGIEVSEQEVERALLKIPPRKATQPGMAPGAAWHFAAPIIAPHVHAFLQDTWKPGPISHSADLTGSWLHFLAKPGRVIRGPSDLRPIALQPGAAKALSVLIKTRLQPFVDEAAKDFPQFAYLCNRGTAQAIGRVTQHCSAVRAAVKGQSLTLHDKFAGVRRLPCSGGCQLAVDMSRAFDSCPRKLLLAALRHFQVPSDLIALIMAWHESSHYELGNMHRSDLSRDIYCTSGVKQGCVIAPSLWTLFTCYVGAKFSEHRDAKWIDDHLTLFADDFHFKWQLDSQKDCRRVLEDLRLIFEVLQEHGLTINPAKSSFLVEVRGPIGDAWLRKHRMRDAEGNWQFVWDLHRRLKVPVVRSFRYLGVMLSYHAFEDETLHFRLQQAQQHRNRLARTLQGRGGLRLEQRRRIWLVCVQTSQLYGLSAVGITEAGYNLLRIQTMKHVRAFAKSPRHLTQESDRSLLDRLGLCAPLQTLMQQVDGIYHRLEQPEFSTLPCYDNAGLLGWFRGIRDDLRLLATKTLGDSVTSEPPPEAGVQDVPTGVVFDPPVLPATEGTTTVPAKLVSMPPQTPQYTCTVCGQQFTTLHQVKTHEGRAHKKFAPKRVVADIVSYALNGLPTCKLCRASFTRWTGLRRHIEENRCPGLREEPVPASPLYDAADASGPRPSQVTATALDLADAAQPTAEGSLMATGPVAASTSSGPPDSGPAQAFESEINNAKPSSECAECSSWKQDDLVSASVLRPAIQWDTVLSIRPPRWESIVRVPGIVSNLQSYCGVCGKWIAEKKGMKRHWQKSHPELWNLHYPLVLHWCKHWAKSAQSPCQICGIKVVDHRQHAGGAQCTVMVQADADGQLRSLFGLMPALQAQQAQETGNSMDVDRTSTKRKDPATNTTRQGSQKGKGKGGLVQHMGRMVLQQAEATNRICLDSGFLLVLQTPPHPGSVTRALCQVGDAWKLKAKEAPTTLTMSLKMAILECLFRELVARANMTMNTPDAKTEAQRLGLLKEDCWTYRQWNPAKSENQTTMSKPVSHQEFCQGVEDFLAHIQKCDGLTRFKALQELTSETTNAAVPFLLDVSFRQDQIHATLVRWIGLSPFELIGARMRQVHAKASPQQTKLYEMLRNLDRLDRLGAPLRSLLSKLLKPPGVRPSYVTKMKEWRTLISGWQQPHQQHDVAEFLMHLILQSHGLPVLSKWYSEGPPVEAAPRNDQGDGLILLPTCNPAQPFATVQQCVQGWHQQLQSHYVQPGTDFVLLQLDRFEQRGPFIRKRRHPLFPGSGTLMLPTGPGDSQWDAYFIQALILHEGDAPVRGHYRAALVSHTAGAVRVCDDSRVPRLAVPADKIFEKVYVLLLSRCAISSEVPRDA
ncbi:cdk7 [Symbiodinium sp. CCMP2592]|nr:cdk7 [Symbiodinium sp. CCMP2592]